jgi:hypothetical protein
MTSKSIAELQAGDDSGTRLDSVQRRCAWHNCRRAIPFNDDLPDGWRCLLIWHSARAMPEQTVRDVAVSEACERDGVLCPDHAGKVDRLLEPRDPDSRDREWKRHLAVVGLLERFHSFADVCLEDVTDAQDHLIARFVTVPKHGGGPRFTVKPGTARQVACIGLDGELQPKRVLWSNVVPADTVRRWS